MLAHWFERGLGQIVAPDKKAAQSPPEGDGDGASLWQIVAPDPSYEASRHGTTNTTPTAATTTVEGFTSPPPNKSDEKVQCEHCHKWTSNNTPTQNPPDDAFVTPSATTMTSPSSSLLNDMVLQAAKDTAFSMTSPPNVAEARNKVFRLCANSKPLNEKMCLRLRKLLQKDPTLIDSRSSHLGNLVSDGYTPLLAAASVNNIPAMEILLELSPHCYRARDLQGRTPLHVAAEMGYAEAVDFLKRHMGNDASVVGPDAPIDLTGLTPLGRAITSPHPRARKHTEELTQQLFSPGDASVCGTKTPAKDRHKGISSDLCLAYGTADMPGFRVHMEDAVCCDFWKDHDSSKALLGVCDGHGDAGLTSAFVAENAGRVLRHTDEYPQHDFTAALTSACLKLDDELQKSSYRGGGTTAALALVTTSAIVVANVGDSRCILIQNKDGRNDSAPNSSLEQAMEDLTLTDEENKPSDKSQQQQEEKASTSDDMDTDSSDGNGIVVKAMSQDHKPNLDGEQRRIEAAGLSVVKETFQEDNKEVAIHKVRLTDRERMAVSRSFGDYEYKANANLSAQEQAVVATPEVVVHARNSQRDLYLVLACDGVWDVMTNDEVANFVVTQVDLFIAQLPSNEVLPHVGDLLLNECLDRGSRDNMTVVIAALHEAADKLGAGVGRTLEFQAE